MVVEPRTGTCAVVGPQKSGAVRHVLINAVQMLVSWSLGGPRYFWVQGEVNEKFDGVESVNVLGEGEPFNGGAPSATGSAAPPSNVVSGFIGFNREGFVKRQNTNVVVAPVVVGVVGYEVASRCVRFVSGMGALGSLGGDSGHDELVEVGGL
jgi:hypothetical protein